LWRPYTSTSVVSRSIVTDRVNASRRRRDTRANIRALTLAIPRSTMAHCRSLIRRANPAAVVEHNPGTGVNS
jgi:hypothetical protein